MSAGSVADVGGDYKLCNPTPSQIPPTHQPTLLPSLAPLTPRSTAALREQFDPFQADVDAGYPEVPLGSPLESKLLDCYMLGTFKGGSSFALGLVMRTVDDHIHVFNVPKGMESKTPEEVRCSACNSVSGVPVDVLEYDTK